MKRTLKIILIVLGSLIVIVSGVVFWIMLAKPNVGAAEDMTIERTPERIARGEYLAWHVMQCMDCHSKRDFTYYSGPPTPGTEGAGGEVFDHTMGFPGTFVSRNITPTGIGDWTDGELFRLITTRVKKDGKPIFPVMPYSYFGRLDPEDINSVIAYIRELPAKESKYPDSNPDFPMNIIMRTMPQKAQLSTRPSRSDSIAYGEYIVTAAGCAECHTKFEKGKFTGPFLAGGRKFPLPDGSILSTPNLTPDETGLKEWSMQQFIHEFKQYEDPVFKTIHVQPGHILDHYALGNVWRDE